MATEPEMLIGSGLDGKPVSAACSLCGEWMPEDYAPDASRSEILEGFISYFRAHVQEKHGPRFVN
jgi:hypothetical protein